MEDEVRLKISLEVDGSTKKKILHLLDKNTFDNGSIKALKRSICEKVLRKGQAKRLSKMSIMVDDFYIPSGEFIRIINPDQLINVKVSLNSTMSKSLEELEADLSSVGPPSCKMRPQESSEVHRNQQLEAVVNCSPFGDVHKSMKMSEKQLSPSSASLSQEKEPLIKDKPHVKKTCLPTQSHNSQRVRNPKSKPHLKFSITKKNLKALTSGVGTLLTDLRLDDNNGHSDSNNKMGAEASLNETHSRNSEQFEEQISIPSHIIFESSEDENEDSELIISPDLREKKDILDEIFFQRRGHGWEPSICPKYVPNDPAVDPDGRYAKCPPLTTFPKVNDRIAFRVLELSARYYRPEVTPYLEGRVIGTNEEYEEMTVLLDDEFIWEENDGTKRPEVLCFDQEDFYDPDFKNRKYRQLRNKRFFTTWRELIEPKRLDASLEL